MRHAKKKKKGQRTKLLFFFFPRNVKLIHICRLIVLFSLSFSHIQSKFRCSYAIFFFLFFFFLGFSSLFHDCVFFFRRHQALCFLIFYYESDTGNREKKKEGWSKLEKLRCMQQNVFTWVFFFFFFAVTVCAVCLICGNVDRLHAFRQGCSERRSACAFQHVCSK